MEVSTDSKVFPHLSCSSLSLGHLLPGKEKKTFLLLSTKVVTFFLLEIGDTSLHVGSTIDVEGRA